MMFGTRSFAALMVALCLATPLSGCFGEDASPQSTSTSSPTPTTSGAANNTTANTTTPSEEPQPPVANFTVSVLNSTDENFTAGAELIFNASASTDPAGGNLSFDWKFGDNGTASGVVTNHTYGSDGNYTVELRVTSDATNLTSDVSANLTIVAGQATAITFTDPTGDAAANYLDIKKVEIESDAEFFIITIGVGAVCPCNAVDSIFMVDFFMNGNRFEVYALGGDPLTLWDSTNAQDVPGAAVRIAGTAFEIKVPLKYLNDDIKKPAPWAIYTETYIGEAFAEGQVPDDRGPDAGTVTYG